MKNSIFSIVMMCIVFCFTATDMNAQCANSSTSSAGGLGFASPGDKFGQSFTIDASCGSSAIFESFSFKGGGNQATTVVVRIYQGTSASGNLRYESDRIVLPIPNRSSWLEAKLGSTSSPYKSLQVLSGQPYFIEVEMINCKVLPHTTGNAVSGVASINGVAKPDVDMIYKVKTGGTSSNVGPAISPLEKTVAPNGFGQSFHATANYSKMTMKGTGGNPTQTVRIYAGENVNGTPLYSHTYTNLPPLGIQHEQVFNFPSNWNIVPGSLYTIYIELESSAVTPICTADQVQGVFYQNGKWHRDRDLIYTFE